MLPDLYITTYTIHDWKLWEGDWELIKGSPVAMSPSPLNKHQLLSGEIHTFFNVSLKKNKINRNCKVLFEQDWIIDDTNIVRPDVMVVCGAIDPNGHIDKTPRLIVEVASASTKIKDRNTKFNLYQYCGVQYYLIANPDNNLIEVFELVEQQYKQIFEPFVFKLDESCSINFSVAEIFST